MYIEKIITIAKFKGIQTVIIIITEKTKIKGSYKIGYREFKLYILTIKSYGKSFVYYDTN